MVAWIGSSSVVLLRPCADGPRSSRMHPYLDGGQSEDQLLSIDRRILVLVAPRIGYDMVGKASKIMVSAISCSSEGGPSVSRLQKVQ